MISDIFGNYHNKLIANITYYSFTKFQLALDLEKAYFSIWARLVLYERSFEAGLMSFGFNRLRTLYEPLYLIFGQNLSELWNRLNQILSILRFKAHRNHL